MRWVLAILLLLSTAPAAEARRTCAWPTDCRLNKTLAHAHHTNAGALDETYIGFNSAAIPAFGGGNIRPLIMTHSGTVTSMHCIMQDKGGWVNTDRISGLMYVDRDRAQSGTGFTQCDLGSMQCNVWRVPNASTQPRYCRQFSSHTIFNNRCTFDSGDLFTVKMDHITGTAPTNGPFRCTLVLEYDRYPPRRVRPY